ncbi:hypothetical protein GCM10023196_065810 [Actinoallomurus vinaceus]|uniref:RNA polymerase sigma-70 region 2 domain-containing protein n=1 Tax=Actinoallomurus vinaceus TaxID=1080074 RepID=A0ABP8UKT8_9ACTN
MAGWPGIDRADDQRLARALDAGDTNALAQLCAAYAARLFDYCHVLLRDQETASQAVHDSLIMVRERISTLSDQRLFRGWLYATTRAECMRRRANAELPAERRRAPEADTEGGIDEATRALVHAALLALNGQQREALDLAVRHGLDHEELGLVLSKTPHEASVLVEQARNDLDDAFSAVVIAATGRDDCPSVPALAGPPGQPLDAERCATLARHIAGCPICGLRVNRDVPTAQLLRAMPAAAVPENLRGRILATAFAPEHAPTRATIAMRLDPPPPAPTTPPEPEGRSRKASRVWVVAGAAACAVLVLCGFFLVSPGSSGSGGERPTGGDAAAAAPGDSPSGDGGTSSHSAGASPTAKTGSPTPTPTLTPTPTPTPSKTSAPALPTHHTRPGPHRPHPTAPSSQPIRFTVTGCSMDHGDYDCQVTLVAEGAPVNWAVTGAKGVSTGGSGSAWPNHPVYLNVSRPREWCWGDGSGAVYFNTGQVARVTWHC